jgi:hypothetical protein
MAQITIDAPGRELAARVTRNEDGEILLVLATGEDGITINAGRLWADADGIAGVGEAIARQAGDLLNEWADAPHDDDGWVILDECGWHARLGGWEPPGQPEGGYPLRRIAVYELARLMAEHAGTNAPAWIVTGDGRPSAQLNAEVRAHLTDGGQLIPLPGTRFEPGTAVTDPDGTAWIVRRDYGDLGVMLHDPAGRAVTGYVLHPDKLTPVGGE